MDLINRLFESPRKRRLRLMTELCEKYLPNIDSNNGESFARYLLGMSDRNMYNKLIGFHEFPEKAVFSLVRESTPLRRKYQKHQKKVSRMREAREAHEQEIRA
jgi:hypothetical protein